MELSIDNLVPERGREHSSPAPRACTLHGHKNKRNPNGTSTESSETKGQLLDLDSGVRPAVVPIALALAPLGVQRAQLLELRRPRAVTRLVLDAGGEARGVLVEKRPRLVVR